MLGFEFTVQGLGFKLVFDAGFKVSVFRVGFGLI